MVELDRIGPYGGGVGTLAQRWFTILSDREGTVFSPVAMWAMLTILANEALGPTRADMLVALGLPSQPRLRPTLPTPGEPTMNEAAQALLWLLNESPSISAAVGYWVDDDIRLRPQWVRSLPPGTVQRLSGDLTQDRAAVDQWAKVRTHGRVNELHGALKAGDKFALASAVTMDMGWLSGFSADKNGRLSRRIRMATPGGFDLVRSTREVTTVTVQSSGYEPGSSDCTVVLVLGLPGVSASRVLQLGWTVFFGRTSSWEYHRRRRGIDPSSPGYRTKNVRRDRDRPEHVLEVSLPAFKVTGSHNLAQYPDVFKLTNASLRQHFRGISNTMFGVQSVTHTATVGFTAQPFTAVPVEASSTEEETSSSATSRRSVGHVVYTFVEIDRPFGFFVIKRGLVLFTGWVTEADWTGGRG